MNELVEMLTGWPLAVSIAAAATGQGLQAGRRRAALNEAMHELRRPLQALALAGGPGGSAPTGIESSLRLAAVALERLDAEVNGGGPEGVREALRMKPLLESAVARWVGRAGIGGESLTFGWHAGSAMVIGDGVEISQALDNLIVNAIEHGGSSIAVEARRRGDRLRISVVDSGAGPIARRKGSAGIVGRLGGRKRRGHGLAVVRRIAAAHGGRFALRRAEHGSVSVLEMPLAAGPEPAS